MTYPCEPSTGATKESLGRYLFGKARFPGWQQDLNRILAGVEVEYLVVNANNPRKVMRKAQYRDFLSRLETQGYSRRHSLPDGDRLSRDSSPGFTVVEPDFAYHVLELALPPRGSVAEIEALAAQVLCDVDNALAAVGCRRLEASSLDDIPPEFDTVGLARLAEFTKLLESAAQPSRRASPYFAPDFGAVFAATHIHLNVSDNESALLMLPALYELEWAAHCIFSRCYRFRGHPCGNARALVYSTTFPETYALVHIPARIPRSLDALAVLYQQSEPSLFPLDGFGGVKDMTIIRPRPFGSFEFRSACSAQRTTDLAAIATFRVAQVAYAARYHDQPAGPDGWQRQAVAAIATQTKPSDLVLDAISLTSERLKIVSQDLPSQWFGSMSSIYAKVASSAGKIARGDGCMPAPSTD